MKRGSGMRPCLEASVNDRKSDARMARPATVIVKTPSDLVVGPSSYSGKKRGIMKGQLD